MKKLKSKSVLCCALAAALSAVLAGSAVIAANADNPVVGDVDGSGSVTLDDAVFLNQFLNGVFTVSDLTKLDVDGNGVISIADSYEIMDIYANNGAGN